MYILRHDRKGTCDRRRDLRPAIYEKLQSIPEGLRASYLPKHPKTYCAWLIFQQIALWIQHSIFPQIEHSSSLLRPLVH